MSTIARLRAFVTVADTGSVRAAAARLVLTESAVSASIAALAKDVGVSLVRREGRGLRLTPAGERYAADARTILGLHERALRAARGEEEPSSGVLRIGATTAVGEFLLPDLLAGFQAAHRQVELDPTVVPTATLWKLFDSHDIDVAIGGLPPLELSPAARAVRSNALIVVATPAATEQVRRVGPGRMTWLLPEQGSGIRAVCLHLLGELGPLPTTLTLGTQGAVIAGVQAGLGMALVPAEAVLTPCATGRLVEIEMPWGEVPWVWQALTHERPSATAELMIFYLLGAAGWSRPPRDRRRLHSTPGRRYPTSA
jgi:DNA-binding transcriptional LysR family regulator